MSEFKDYFQRLKSSFSASAIDKAFTLEDEYKILKRNNDFFVSFQLSSNGHT